MDKKVTAILLRSSDYKDNDKKIELYSVEEGVMRVTAKGVRKKDAKLKFACQPFAFCVYELAEKNGNYTLTGATSVEDMFSLTSDFTAYACAGAAAECMSVSGTSLDSQDAFLVFLKTLKALLFSRADKRLITAKFVQKIISMSGFDVTRAISHDEPSTVRGLKSLIATKYLDELDSVTAPESICKRAAISELKRFERIYETKLNSVKLVEST